MQVGGCACVSISLGEPLSQVLSEGMSLHVRSPHSTRGYSRSKLLVAILATALKKL